MIPLQLRSDAEFASLRTLLQRHAYTTPSICARTEVETLYDLHREWRPESESALRDGQDALLRLLFEGGTVADAELPAALSADDLALLASFGLIRRMDHGAWRATVMLYPNAGIWLVSDLPDPIESTGEGAGADRVYYAATSSVRVFLSTMPQAPTGRFLELCSGTGVAALLAAQQGAAHAWAVDITHRSTVFAEFNRRLNGLANVSAVEGDLYAPVAGETFDWIVAHPPYVAAPTTEFIFRDGGDDGEQITRAILGDAYRHLADGGTLICTCTISQRRGMSTLDRVKELIGEHADGFEIVYVRNGIADAMRKQVNELLSSDPERSAGALALLHRFQQLKIEKVELCTIVLRKHGQNRAGHAIHTERNGSTTFREIEWLLGLQAVMREDDFMERLLDAPIRLSPHARLALEFSVSDDADAPWAPLDGTLTVGYPLPGRSAVNGSDANLLATFRGQHTLRAQMMELLAAGLLPQETEAARFIQAIAPFLMQGILETALHPLPQPPA